MVDILTKLAVVYASRRFLTSKTMGIKTFVFLDLETTGLPHMEHNKTKITEMCAIAVQSDHIDLGCFPRVHNKLSFCFNPRKMIHPQCTDITGLSNELLEHQTSFSLEVVDVLTKWLEMNQNPICLVAHNGNRFDYPILRAEVENVGGRLPENLFCIDSLQAFRELDKQKEEQEEVKEEIPLNLNDGYDEILCSVCEELEESVKNLTAEEIQKINETTPRKQKILTTQISKNPKRKIIKDNKSFVSYKLQDIYTRMTNKQPQNVHEAEGDVVMMITCAAVLGERFVAFANENAKTFSEIPPMKPFRKLGF